MTALHGVARWVRAASIGCFAGILVLGAGFLATTPMLPRVAGFLEGDAIADGRAYQLWFRLIIGAGMVAVVGTTLVTWWRSRPQAR